MTIRYDRSILPLLERGPRLRNSEEKFISDVLSFVPLDQEESPDKEKQLYVIDIPHRFMAMPSKRNKTHCFSWEGLNRETPTGSWTSESCIVLHTEPNKSSCLCPLPGHFTVVMIPTNLTDTDEVTSKPLKPVLITCLVSLICLVLGLITYLMTAKCWWTIAHHHIYTVIIPIAVLVLGHAVFISFCVILMIHWQDEWKYRDRRKCLMDIGRSESLLVLLVGFSMIATSLDSDPSQIKLLAVVALNAFLSLATVLFLVILKKPMRMAVISLFCPSKDAVEKSVFTDFRGNPASHAELEAQKIHDYCETVDRQRYTSEHKRQLRHLINGSSPAAGSYSAGAFSVPLGISDHMAGSRLSASRTCDSASETVSFSNGGSRKRKRRFGAASPRILKPEPSVSRLQDSGTISDKPILEKGSYSSATLAKERIKYSNSSSSLPLPIVPMALISMNQEKPSTHKDISIPGNTPGLSSKRQKRTKPSIAETENLKKKISDLKDEEISSHNVLPREDDTLSEAPLVKKNLKNQSGKKRREACGNRSSTSDSTNHFSSLAEQNSEKDFESLMHETYDSTCKL
ncbi:hypothetical protein PoB_002498600 [Plakobranchus ocellatus]|uniref:GPS domain-containing protein n=1 Tax=Plakobranchus ocellatus TaxID=259542 RepID=A0AAV3ZH43_9GAST|nr:hypothetical protein PoB_002498600 [Plakobranchus ocellatus]